MKLVAENWNANFLNKTNMADETGEQLWSKLAVFYEVESCKQSISTMPSFAYFTPIYEDVMGVNLKFLKKKGRERLQCKYGCTTCILVLNISFSITNK